MRKTIIHGGTLITAEETFPADIFIKDEKIELVGQNLEIGNARQVDARGKLIMPGGVDPHVHLDLPMFNTVSSDDYYTGGKAAAFGGTTTLLDFVPQDGPTLRESIEIWLAKSEGKATVDFGLHMNITRMDQAVLEEIPALVDLGIPSLKLFTAYNGRLRLQDGEIFQVMRVAGRHGLLTLLHAENGDVNELLIQEALASGKTAPIWHARTRPAWGEADAVMRGVALAAQTGAALYIVHLNTSMGLDQVRYGRKLGLPIMAETCPAYLFFTEEHLKRPDGSKWVCSPPMRTGRDNAALWEGLADGSVQVMGTDHCPFFYDGSKAIDYEGKAIAIPGKELGRDDFTKIPNGLPGVADRMPILWTYGVGEELITPNQFVALTSTNPAKAFGLFPKKGALQPGSDADIVVWDPEKRLTYGVAHAHQRTDYNLFEGWELKGFPEKVFLRGTMIVHGQRWLGKEGEGKFLKRTAFSERL
jgi:dihydropyrimidinase